MIEGRVAGRKSRRKLEGPAVHGRGRGAEAPGRGHVSPGLIARRQPCDGLVDRRGSPRGHFICDLTPGAPRRQEAIVRCKRRWHGDERIPIAY
jgi:hypothetical protein